MTGANEHRTSPLARQLPLWVGYALIVAAAIATVLVPEMSEPPAEEAPRTAEAP